MSLNFSKISYRSLIGRLLRLPLRLIPSKTKMPILQGRLRGKKWIVGSSNHGCWLGSYECKKQRFFEKTISEGGIVFDLGAHVGFYTLLTSELVGPKGKVIAFEPLPRNLEYLRKHLEINHCCNVEIIEAAVIEKNGLIPFEEGPCHTMGSSSRQGNFKVRGVSLDDLVLKGEIPPPNYVKIDIEGDEYSALLGARSVIADFHPTIFLASHGEKIQQKCAKLLKSFGYTSELIDTSKGGYYKEEIYK